MSKDQIILSIIIPTFNEMKHGLLKDILKAYSSLENIEIICVDSQSSDGTIDLINSYQVKLYSIKTTSRAVRLNEGARKANGQMLLFHHPRSIIDIAGINYLIKHSNDFRWGAFTHKFDHKHKLLGFTSWYSNYIRGDRKGIFYLDHCIYCSRELFEKVGDIPEVDIFEDTYLSLNLLKYARPKRLPYISKTSAIRFTQNGVLKQALLNQILKWKFYFSSDDKKMNNTYEKKLSLNADYEKDD